MWGRGRVLIFVDNLLGALKELCPLCYLQYSTCVLGKLLYSPGDLLQEQFLALNIVKMGRLALDLSLLAPPGQQLCLCVH